MSGARGLMEGFLVVVLSKVEKKKGKGRLAEEKKKI